MNKMAKLLGAGKWLTALTVVACGGNGGEVTAALTAGAGGEADSVVMQSRAGSGNDGGATVTLSTAGQPSATAGSTQAQAAGAGGIVEAAGAMSGGSGSESAAGGRGSGGSIASSAGAGGSSQGGASGSAGAGAAATGGVAGAGGSGGAISCECSTGQCCDGCHLRPSSYQLGMAISRTGCGSAANAFLIVDTRPLDCTGTSATEVAWGNYNDEQESVTACASGSCWAPCWVSNTCGQEYQASPMPDPKLLAYCQ